MSDTTYADGTYGGSADASRDLERDQHAAFTDQQAAVLALAYDAGPTGITGHDVQVATGWGDSSKSRALSNLLRDGKLARLSEKRDRGSVHVLPEHVNGRDLEPYVSVAEKHYARGHADGVEDGTSLGLDRAFTIVDNSDSLGDALIALRRLIEARQ
ncbi:hypothetical protein SEA_PIPERIS_60 [Microbacterium phage Piperis]|uniref:Uncharacterized protein n=2 Tax=Quhwahvirus kaihaidragon TaxID=2283289 RepID=A0A4Y5P059_9CAUD|nr:hypothetical protein SEA_PIPERIS_60 [Microbacterium phage Piperis]QWY84840.1 hypothetical protein SEA_SELWYN23_60 [Microbacterium phage Selwyn23]